MMKKAFVFIGKVVDKVLSLDTSKRVALGASLSISSIIYVLLLGTTVETNMAGSILGSMICVLGLFIVVPDANALNDVFFKMAITILKVMATLIAAYIINNCMDIGLSYLNNSKKIEFAISIFIVIYYCVTFFKNLFILFKKIMNKIIEKINFDALENGSKKIDEIIKNLISIAGGFALVYNFIKPILENLK